MTTVDVEPELTPVAPAATLAAEQSPAAPEIDELRRRILARTIESSQSVPPPPLWARFGNSRSTRRLSCEPAELLSRLGQHFAADQLLAARVAVRAQSGEFELSNVLTTDEAFVIRRDATGAASDVVSHRGKLSSGACEWRELAAQTPDGNSPPEQPVVLAATDAELYVLGGLEISRTPLAGVDELTGKQVRALFEQRAKQPQQRRYQLVLLGWQPATLINEPSIKHLAAIRHVADIQPSYGFDPHTVFRVWLPTRSELARIRRALSFVDRRMVADEFRSSLQNSAYAPTDALNLLADRKPATWAKARAALESAVERLPRGAARSGSQRRARKTRAFVSGSGGAATRNRGRENWLAGSGFDDRGGSCPNMVPGAGSRPGRTPSDRWPVPRIRAARRRRRIETQAAARKHLRKTREREVWKMTAICRTESMMNPNHNHFAASDDGSCGFPSSDEGSPREDCFAERIRAFEQCSTSGAAGITNFLRVAAADLFRTMPLVERGVVEELRQAVEHPLEHQRPALRQYTRHAASSPTRTAGVRSAGN